jgi:cytidine deaminase
MDPLLTAALDARHRAHAPYSRFHVGAALEHHDGRIFTGCNIENSSYGLTVCAERVAAFSAIAAGCAPHTFRRIAVCAEAGPVLTPPCGACRQVLWDLCGPDLEVILLASDGRAERLLLRDLLPRAFDAASLTSPPPADPPVR